MAERNQHVVPHPQGWAVKKEWSNRATAIFDTQKEAIEYGRRLAIRQRTELIIHNRKGEVRKSFDYRDRDAQSRTRKGGFASASTNGLDAGEIALRYFSGYSERGDDR